MKLQSSRHARPFRLWLCFSLLCDVITQNVDDTQELLSDIDRVVKIWEASPPGYRTPHSFADAPDQWASDPASGASDGPVAYEIAACVLDRAFGAALTGRAIRVPRQGASIDLRDNGMPSILLENLLFDLPACCIAPHQGGRNSLCLDAIRSGYAVLQGARERLATGAVEARGEQELDRVIDELVSTKAFKALAQGAAALALHSGKKPGKMAAAVLATAERCTNAAQCATVTEGVAAWLSHEGHKRARVHAAKPHVSPHTDL